MSTKRFTTRKVLLGLAVVGVAVACASAQTRSSGPPAPRDLIAQLVKYSAKPMDPKRVAVVAAIDFDGNVSYIVPEGTVERPFTGPVKASAINNADAIGITAFTHNPPCVLLVGGGSRYWYCPQ